MRAGKLRFRVELQDYTTTKSTLNQRVKDPTRIVLGTYWCDIANLSGRELINAQQVQATVTHKVTMRFPGFEIKPTWRLLFKEHAYEILWVDNVDQRSRTILLYCSSVESA